MSAVISRTEEVCSNLRYMARKWGSVDMIPGQDGRQAEGSLVRLDKTFIFSEE